LRFAVPSISEAGAAAKSLPPGCAAASHVIVQHRRRFARDVTISIRISSQASPD
jgi:hypothetical protein